MRVWSHYATIHRESLDFRIYTFFAHLHETVRVERLHCVVDLPFRARRHLHVPELLNALHLWSSLEQTHSLLTRHGGLHVVIVRVGRMVSDHDVRLTLLDGILDELHQLQMRYRVHLDVRESRLIDIIHTKALDSIVRIILKFPL